MGMSMKMGMGWAQCLHSGVGPEGMGMGVRMGMSMKMGMGWAQCLHSG